MIRMTTVKLCCLSSPSWGWQANPALVQPGRSDSMNRMSRHELRLFFPPVLFCFVFLQLLFIPAGSSAWDSLRQDASTPLCFGNPIQPHFKPISNLESLMLLWLKRSRAKQRCCVILFCALASARGKLDSTENQFWFSGITNKHYRRIIKSVCMCVPPTLQMRTLTISDSPVDWTISSLDELQLIYRCFS